MKKTIISIIVGAMFIIAPFTAQASTMDDLRTQIASLLQMVMSLQQQLAQTTGGSAVTDLASQSLEQCEDFTYNLYLGKRDAQTNGEVSKLQRFLTKTGDYNNIISGYFGPATERGVQSWQRKHNVVSSGTPDSTGYGVVGPITRKNMRCSVLSTEVVKNFLIATPQLGTSPLRVMFTTDIISGNTSDEKIYLDFGDGERVELSSDLTSCRECFGFGGYTGPPLKIEHTYSNIGTYTATIDAELSNYFDNIQKRIVVTDIQLGLTIPDQTDCPVYPKPVCKDGEGLTMGVQYDWYGKCTAPMTCTPIGGY
jgi:PKD repeat protein